MVVELAAVRLLAPWFGTSQTVWTNVIAVILLALALGYMLGGRLTERPEPVQAMAMALMLAGAWVLWLPTVVPVAAGFLVPEGLALHELAVLVGWGSLALASVAFLPPATMLGMVCPLALERLARERGLSAGRSAGAVLFASTAGSLLGVFGTSHVLIPECGLRQTFWLAGGILFSCGVLARALRTSRSKPDRLGFFLVLLGTAAAPLVPAPSPRLSAGSRVLASRESPYQSVRVVEGALAGPQMRYLQVNEGTDSFQSVWQPASGLLPDGFYYNDFLLPSCWTSKRDPWQVLVLGLGAGSAVRVFSPKVWPRTTFLGVELDPVVVEFGFLHFDLDAESTRLEVVSGLDARVALRALSSSTFDQLVIDCYANQFEIPAHLCSTEFFREAKDRLRDGGWLTANVGGFGFDDPVVRCVAISCAVAFQAPVVLVRVPMSRNYMLVARRGEQVPWENDRLKAPLSSSVLPLGPRTLPGFSHLVLPDDKEEVLTDDRNPIELLQRASLLEARRRVATTARP